LRHDTTKNPLLQKGKKNDTVFLRHYCTQRDLKTSPIFPSLRYCCPRSRPGYVTLLQAQLHSNTCAADSPLLNAVITSWKGRRKSNCAQVGIRCVYCQLCDIHKGGQLKPIPKHGTLVIRSMTALAPVLSSNSILPPASFHCFSFPA
jgi:hypothetical protein